MPFREFITESTKLRLKTIFCAPECQFLMHYIDTFVRLNRTLTLREQQSNSTRWWENSYFIINHERDRNQPFLTFAKEPPMTKGQLYANWASIFGMWFGLSILAIHDHLLRKAKKLWDFTSNWRARNLRLNRLKPNFNWNMFKPNFNFWYKPKINVFNNCNFFNGNRIPEFEEPSTGGVGSVGELNGVSTISPVTGASTHSIQSPITNNSTISNQPAINPSIPNSNQQAHTITVSPELHTLASSSLHNLEAQQSPGSTIVPISCN